MSSADGHTPSSPGPIARHCSRPLCSLAADVVLLFEYRASHVVLDWTVAERDPNHLELCLAHAESFQPPKGWTLEDRRASIESMSAKPVVR